MAPKIFKQAFTKDFQGISGECAAIEPDGGEVNRAVNYEYSVGNSLRGRVGCQTAGSYGFFAIFPYRYTRTQDQYDIVYQTAAGAYPTQTPGLATTKTSADGASIEKIIALSQQAWVLDTMNITISQINTGAYTWYTYVVSLFNINFNIKKNGVSILDTNLGDGITSSTSIYSLLGTIDALADLAVSRTTRGTCPPYAIINGNQTSAAGTSAVYGTRYTWTVSSHNFQAGDIVTWINSSSGALQAGFVITVTATTIVYVGGQATATDGQILGYMGQAATGFQISTASSESGGIMTISFPYWRNIPEGDNNFGDLYSSAYATWQAKTTDSFYAPAVAENAAGNLYIAASGLPASVSATWANNLVKIDSLQATRAGLPTPTIIATAAVPGTGVLTGDYKYKAFLRRYDAQGNIIDGPVSSVSSITAATSYTTVVFTDAAFYSQATGFGVRSALKRTTESPAAGSSFYADDNDSTGTGVLFPFLQPGDVICLTDNTAQTTGLYTSAALGAGDSVGTLHTTRCTAYTELAATISPGGSSIKVADSSGYQINDNTVISAGMTMVVLRTTAGGNGYYQLGEVPIGGYTTGSTIYDNVTDAVLITKSQYIEVEIGKEHNAPPSCSLVCQHQGGLVVARGLATPNTVAFSTADGIEYFPTASNSFDVPSTQSGPITAIASDTTDRLAVFKRRAYYDIQGDLDGGVFSVNVKNEGDYGIASQSSLVRINNALLGVSELGWVTVQDGLLDPYKFKSVSARLINQSYRFAWATAVNDYFNRQYVCSIPQVTGEPVTYVIDYSRNQIITLERSYPTKIDPVGGMAMVGDTLYHLSSTTPYGVFRRLARFNGDSPTGQGDGDSFVDNTNAISYILESQSINFGEPGQLKSPIRIRIWSIPNDYIIEGWVNFSLLVETGATPLAQYVGSGGTNNTSSTVVFSTATDVYRDVKLANQKCHFYIVRFTTNTTRTAPFITGYEIMFTENYDKEDFVK